MYTDPSSSVHPVCSGFTHSTMLPLCPTSKNLRTSALSLRRAILFFLLSSSWRSSPLPARASSQSNCRYSARETRLGWWWERSGLTSTLYLWPPHSYLYHPYTYRVSRCYPGNVPRRDKSVDKEGHFIKRHFSLATLTKLRTYIPLIISRAGPHVMRHLTCAECEFIFVIS